MPRYYFKITNGRPHLDDTGEELRDVREAWLATKRLARDIEDSLDVGGRWTVEVKDSNGPIYRITIAAEKLR